MTSQILSLADLGWTPFFRSQISREDQSRFLPVRVMAVHRGQLAVAGDGFETVIPAHVPHVRTEEDRPTVGDWLLIDRATHRPDRVLRRTNLFKRRAPGTDRKLQLIAANVDVLFIVSSCNQDFNLARLERYLVLAREVGVMPIVVLTKADLAEDPEAYIRAARALQPGLLVEAVDARDPESVARIAAWCGPGQSVALLGSSGVGKSTLINTLTGIQAIATQTVRVDDDKGRHTTSARALHRLAQGGWLVDTPGMRELQLTDVATGIEEVFDDIVFLARQCRFTDCRHETEPGCAVKAAIADGRLDLARFERWRKLAAEDAYNTESLAERRARDRAFGKMVRSLSRQK
jgi:ribosome biogenesis GTPase